MKLPPGDGDFVLEGVAVDRDEGEGEDEGHVYVGIPFTEISLGDGQHLDRLIY